MPPLPSLVLTTDCSSAASSQLGLTARRSAGSDGTRMRVRATAAPCAAVGTSVGERTAGRWARRHMRNATAVSALICGVCEGEGGCSCWSLERKGTSSVCWQPPIDCRPSAGCSSEPMALLRRLLGLSCDRHMRYASVTDESSGYIALLTGPARPGAIYSSQQGGLLRMLRIRILRKLRVRRVRSKITLGTVAVHGTRDFAARE